MKSNQKFIFYSEWAYVAGILLLALGTAFMEKANYGMSMVVAPAYLIYLKVSQVLPFFTFGMAEYCLQAILLILLTLVMRKFRMFYLFSFVTAVVYGFTLDFMMAAVGLLPMNAMWERVVFFVVGMVGCSLGVALLFHTYIAPEAYELFVKELSAKTGREIHKVKTVYDCTSCVVAIILSFLFFGFGHFEGVKWGTVICALINGWMIGQWNQVIEHKFEFRDLKKLFMKS